VAHIPNAPGFAGGWLLLPVQTAHNPPVYAITIGEPRAQAAA